ncbi:MAG: VF530 family protein [Methylotenera sp.]|nr:VF530 family protein [Methylotenera sp.]
MSISPPKQPNNPLHGLTLEAILTALVLHYNWAELARRIPVRCFSNDPSIASSLKFLRKTPWARDKVEGLYVLMLREIHCVYVEKSSTGLNNLK